MSITGRLSYPTVIMATGITAEKGRAATLIPTANTATDANGLIEKPPPIAKLSSTPGKMPDYLDGFSLPGCVDMNEEAGGIAAGRVSVGVYNITVALGFVTEGRDIGIPQDVNGSLLYHQRAGAFLCYSMPSQFLCRLPGHHENGVLTGCWQREHILFGYIMYFNMPKHESGSAGVNPDHMRKYPPCRFSIAPMLDWTDRHCRYFHRLLTKETLLYTEMVTTGAIIHGKGDYLAYSEEEHPVALQLGGSDPAALARCAKMAEQRGYDEINLNVGCPSDRVQNGMFGACLMGQAMLVADCIKAMRDVVSIPVTVKTRIGIDEQDSYEFLCDFIATVADGGECDMFTLHARKAWLSGLSPKENREVPPLDYSRVYQLKQDFPALTIAINGGVKTLEEARQHLQRLDGVMMGREAYQNPDILARVDSELFGAQNAVKNNVAIIESLYPYIERELSKGTYLSHITRHILGLFQGVPGARRWRRHLSENAHRPGADVRVVEAALDLVRLPRTEMAE